MTRILIPRLDTTLAMPAGGDVVVLGGETMGTTWSLSLPGPAALDGAHALVRSAFDLVIAQMSPWTPASDISRFNAAPPGSWTPLPPEFLEVLDCAMEVTQASQGAYDPAIGALVDLWGFGPAPAITEPPKPSKIAAAKIAGGPQAVVRDGDRLFQPGGLRLDLSGVAKGFAADLAARRLEAAGARSFLIEVGGELVGRGLRPDGQPWWIAIELPPNAPLEPLRLAALDVAIATSGDYRKCFDHAGRRYAHTIDPRSGWPVQNGLSQVTVIAGSAMQADAEATAILVLGPEKGLDYATWRGLAALLVETEGRAWKETFTPSFADMLSD